LKIGSRSTPKLCVLPTFSYVGAVVQSYEVTCGIRVVGIIGTCTSGMREGGCFRGACPSNLGEERLTTGSKTREQTAVLDALSVSVSTNASTIAVTADKYSAPSKY